jgi:hypothetical protein
MTGFGIEETADGFILRRGDEESDEETRMSKEEFFSLRAQMNLWTERRLLEYQVASGEMRHPSISAVSAERSFHLTRLNQRLVFDHSGRVEGEWRFRSLDGSLQCFRKTLT